MPCKLHDSIRKNEPQMKEIAKQYIMLGYSCLPVKKDKSPDVKGTWKDGITDSEQYKDAHGIGIICGEKSDNLECLDFDCHFGDAKENLTKFFNQIKEIHDRHGLVVESTQSGGYHVLYKCEKIEGNLKLASRPLWSKKENRWKPDAIIETRGEGGYFVVAPTPGYRFVRNNLSKIPTISVEERKEIIDICKSFNEWYEVKRETYEEKDRPGDRFNQSNEAREEMITVLKNAGWTELKRGLWMRPGKKEGQSATLDKVADNIFYVFSSNAYPFEPNAGYTPFQVVGLLKYSGDFNRFAKDLAERYGDLRQEKKPEKKTQDQLDRLLNKAHIDLKTPVPKPPIILKIKEQLENGEIAEKRLFTLGNFSAVTGKSKSKKTMLTSIMLAAAAKSHWIYNKIGGNLPNDKPGVILFDTEQSKYDSYVAAKRIETIAGKEYENFGAFYLREYEPLERCEIIDYALKKLSPKVGYIVIDGIADLGRAINDEDEANRVVTLLMKWTEKYNIHITNVIHQNKGDNWATGHIGSAILKKAETIISVAKDNENPYLSHVECSMIRGVSDFKPFDLEINQEGIPFIEDMRELWENYTEVDLT